VFNKREKVLWNKNIGSSYYSIGLTCEKEYVYACPGQFVMIGIPDRRTPLLSRPFSIHNLIYANGFVEGIEILYKVVGESTKNLSKAKKNDSIQVLGPLGKGFSVPDNARKIGIVAGGIGVAPMLFLVSQLELQGFDFSGSTLFLGGKNSSDILCRNKLADYGIRVEVTTDDGSEGGKGLVTDLLEFASENRSFDIIFACGPVAMLKAVAKLSEIHHMLCQISIETIMACGMGVCLGCAVETNNINTGYLHACVDGPVFDSKIIKL